MTLFTTDLFNIFTDFDSSTIFEVFEQILKIVLSGFHYI